jgi:hypothetical protein
MARKTKTKQKVKPSREKAPRGPSAIEQWVASVPREAWGRVLKIGLGVLVLCGLGFGAAVGLQKLKDRLRGSDRYVVGRDAVRIVSEPALPIPPAVKTHLEQDTGLPERFNLLDDGLPAWLAGHYADQPWVRQVVRVQRIYPGRIDVELAYRRPVAFVTNRDPRDPSAELVNDYYWVDDQGVRLPGIYTYNEVHRRVGQMVICQVAAPPPAEGHVWADPRDREHPDRIAGDLAAGLRLVQSLSGHVARLDLMLVNVANYHGRLNPARSHMVLLTPDNTEIYWGSAPGEEGVYEIPLERKLYNLDWFYARQDGKKPGLQGRQFVYIRVDLPEVYYQPRTADADGVLRG